MSARVILLLTAALALTACDQPAAQDETAAPPVSAVQVPTTTPAADGAAGKDCGRSFFYNFSDQRGSGQVMCSSNQQS